MGHYDTCTTPAIFKVDSTLTVSGVTLTTAATATWKALFASAVASALVLPTSCVTVTGVTAGSRRRLTATTNVDRQLTASSVNVAYTVSAANTNTAALQNKINTATSSGALTTASTYVDLTPTAAPTTSPNKSAASGRYGGFTKEYLYLSGLVIGALVILAVL